MSHVVPAYETPSIQACVTTSVSCVNGRPCLTHTATFPIQPKPNVGLTLTQCPADDLEPRLATHESRLLKICSHHEILPFPAPDNRDVYTSSELQVQVSLQRPLTQVHPLVSGGNK
jgi:hypothetical protein